MRLRHTAGTGIAECIKTDAKTNYCVRNFGIIYLSGDFCRINQKRKNKDNMATKKTEKKAPAKKAVKKTVTKKTACCEAENTCCKTKKAAKAKAPSTCKKTTGKETAK